MSDNVSIFVSGRKYVAWETATIQRTIDAPTTFAFTAPFDPERGDFREVFRPLAFRPVTIDVGDERLMTGTLVGIDPSFDSDSNTVSATGYSLPGILSDVTMPISSFPLEWSGLRLDEIAAEVCRPFGIQVVVAEPPPAPIAPPTQDEIQRHMSTQADLSRAMRALAEVAHLPDDDPDKMRLQRQVFQMSARARESRRSSATHPAIKMVGAPFESVAMTPDQSPGTFLMDLARQRGVILGDTTAGELLILRSSSSNLVATLRQGQPPLTGVVATFNPQIFCSELTGLSPSTSGRPGGGHTLTNPLAHDVFRPRTFSVDDATEAARDLPAAVTAQLGRILGEVVSYSIKGLPGWRTPAGALWTPNTTVKVTAPSAMVYSETELLIRAVTLSVTPDAVSTDLELVLPGAFSGEMPTRLPWD